MKWFWQKKEETVEETVEEIISFREKVKAARLKNWAEYCEEGVKDSEKRIKNIKELLLKQGYAQNVYFRHDNIDMLRETFEPEGLKVTVRPRPGLLYYEVDITL